MSYVMIYGLFDPTSRVCRYIGQTKYPHRRFKGHLRDTQGCTPKSRWIVGLTRRGLEPIMASLEIVPEIESIAAEEFWIHLLQSLGLPLLNAPFAISPTVLQRHAFIAFEVPEYKRPKLQSREIVIDKAMAVLMRQQSQNVSYRGAAHMSGCEICEHVKINMIMNALATGRSPNLIRAQFRLPPVAWAEHLNHVDGDQVLGNHSRSQDLTASAVLDPTLKVIPPRNHCPVQPLPALTDETPADDVALQAVAEHDFRRGWQHMDTPTRQRNVSWLQEQLLGLDWGA